MEGARSEKTMKVGRKAAEPRPAYEAMSPEEIVKLIAKLEQQMYKHAQELEFEEAARLRDQIEEVRRIGLGPADALAG